MGARVRLNIGVVSMKKSTSTVNREALDTIDVFLTTVIAVVWQNFIGDFGLVPFAVNAADALKTWVAFRIFVGKD